MLIRFIFAPFHIVSIMWVIVSIKKTVLIWKLELNYVNLLLLLMASTLSVTLHPRNGTPYLIMEDLSLLYLVLEDS